MSISHRTNRLKLLGQPSVEQLQNDRYRLTLACRPLNPKNDWFYDNRQRIFMDFGSLYSSTGAPIIDGVGNRPGETYPNMRLVSTSSAGSGSDYVITLVYETLGSTFVQTKDDTISYTESGLRTVERESIAAAGTVFNDADVGSTSISSQIDNEAAVTCYLARYEVDDTDSYRKVTEQYVEAGTLSRTEDFVGSQDSLVIEAIGPDPATPSGFSLASKQESNFEGFQTNRFTFLKDNVELSRSNDLVGSQLAITREFFNPASDPTESGYSLASKQQSDFEGIKTVRYTFLKEDVKLSQSEDEVGSQNAITEQWFKPSASRDTKTGYSLASKEESEVEGIPTERYTFLKPSILSVQQEFNQPRDRITVRAFNKTSAAVDTALSEITVNHRLIAQSEDDFEGIKTSVYTYELNFSDTITTEENGLRTLTRSRILTAGTSYTGTVGSTTITNEINPDTDPSDEVDLYLASFSIQDTEQFRLVTEVYLEAGTFDERIETGPSGLPNTIVKTVRSRFTPPTSNGITLSKSNRNVNGLDEYEYRFLEKADGTTPVGTGVNLVEYEKNIQVRTAGVISATTATVGNGSIAVLNTVPPSVKSVKADVTIVLTTSSLVQAPVAYNLSNTSASASVTTTRVSPVGVEEGNNLTVSVFNTGATARTTAFPNHYRTGAGVNVSYTSPAQIIKDDDNIIGEALNETVSTSITLTGSNTAPATTGVYQEDVDPVFFNADGTQYFRKTTYTIPSS